jgi:hypothetical protein
VFANITKATNELLAYAPSIQYRGLRYGHPLWLVDMQGTLKGIRICHGDPVYIEHQGRVAGGLVGSLYGNRDYSIRLRVTGVWTDTNVGAHRTSGGYFYLEFPRERVCLGPRVSGIARWIMSRSPLAKDPGFAEWLMARIILPPCVTLWRCNHQMTLDHTHSPTWLFSIFIISHRDSGLHFNRLTHEAIT